MGFSILFVQCALHHFPHLCYGVRPLFCPLFSIVFPLFTSIGFSLFFHIALSIDRCIVLFDCFHLVSSGQQSVARAQKDLENQVGPIIHYTELWDNSRG
jgi:hypothetical protein